MSYDHTPALLRELLCYEPDTGTLRWKVDLSVKARAGKIAGSLLHRGYWVVSIFGRPYQGHRIAWIIHHGAPIPDGMVIDHINGVRHDNRIENLRLATISENGQNRKVQKNNTTGYTGVQWVAQQGKWRAYIKVNRKYLSLGTYETPEEADRAYRAAKADLHKFSPNDAAIASGGEDRKA